MRAGGTMCMKVAEVVSASSCGLLYRVYSADCDSKVVANSVRMEMKTEIPSQLTVCEVGVKTGKPRI